MSPLPKPKAQWLKNAEAAELLAVDVRTIKRWMSRHGTRAALLAVQHGKQWRIPRPENLDFWESETRARLNALGITLRETWERDLERLAKEFRPYWPEFRRLYLAVCAKALSLGRITMKAKLGVDLLCHAALEIMEREKVRFGVEALKRKVPRHHWRYWPRQCDFEAIKDTHTRRDIEVERRRLDFVRAVRILRRSHKKPTAENLCPLLHQDWLADFNATKEVLPSGVIDFRQRQSGISLDQFRRRYQLQKQPWYSIIAKVYGILGSIPGADEKPHIGKTPQRGSKDEAMTEWKPRPSRRRRL